MDELLAGQWLSPRVCPHCGHPPDDFVDDDTIGPGWDCMVTLLSPTTNSCGRVVVECQQQPGALPPRCRSLTPAGCSRG